MSYETRQKTQYEGHNRWQWSVWIEGSDRELSAVKSATYYLHATYPNRVRKIEDRSTKFRLDSGGWGGFTIRIVLEMTSGKKTRLSHELELYYPDKLEKVKKGSGPKKDKSAAAISRVFISSSAADQSFAAMIREALKSEKITSTELSLSVDAPVEVAIRDAIRGSDIVVAVRSDSPSLFVDEEITFAKSTGKPVITVDTVKKEVSIETPASVNPKTSQRSMSALNELS